MGRKNSRVERSKDRGRRARQIEQSVPKVKKHRTPRVSVEDMVIPDGMCRFQGKPLAIFATREKAQKALDQAQRQRARTGSGHVEKRYYSCPEGGCGGFHLTSRDEFDENAWKKKRRDPS